MTFRKSLPAILITFAVFVLLLIPRAQAQVSSTGAITGRVADPSNAVVPSANVTLRNDNTGEVRTTTTNAVGLYNFPLLPPGTYTLSVKKEGFQAATVNNIIVLVNTSTRSDVTLQLGLTSQSITVQAATMQVNTESPTLGIVIGPRPITELPLNGRDFMQLATLSAGVNPPAVQNGQSTTQSLSGGRPTLTVSVSGSREISPDFLFDGVPSKQDFYGAVGIEPPVDSIAEFKIQRGYFSPQYGLPAVINVVTKSGTNSFHGAAWEFFRNTTLNARNFFDVNRLPYHQNQYGANLGGPILRNKLLFFIDYEGFQVGQTNTAQGIEPTAAMLSGDFGGLAPVLDPSTYNPTTGQEQPFAGNVIPQSEISPFASKYERFIPLPNVPSAAPGAINYIANTQHLQKDNKFDVRTDFLKSEKDTIFGRFSFLNSGEEDTSIYPGGGGISPMHSRNAVLGWTHTFSPTLVNDFRMGLDRVFLFSATPINASSSPDWPTAFGLTNLNQIPACNGVPAVGISGFATYGFAFSNCIITGNTNKLFLDNVSYTHGRHNLTVGGQLIRINFRDIGSFTQNGNLNFTGQYTGDPVADFLLGAPANVSGEKPTSPTYRNGWWPDLYVNDDFHATRRLTLNLGLRWQYSEPLVEKYNNEFALNFTTGQEQRAGTDGVPRGVLTPQWADFAPRIGFAYSPRESWVIRSSYGIFFDRLPGNEWIWSSIGPPFLVGFSESGDPHVPTISIPGLFPAFTPNLQGASLFDLAGLNRKDPELMQWTYSVQHTLPGNILATVAYVGSKGTYLSKRVDANLDPSPPAPGDTRSVQQRRPFPQWSFILTDEGRANSEYNSLQVSVERQFSHGITFLTGYTWAHSDDNDSYDGKATRNYRPGDMDHGPSIFDIRQRFTASLSYPLPLGRNTAGLLKQAMGGWQIQSIVSLQTGLPFQVTTAADFSNTGAFWIPRPNRICDGNLAASQQTRLHWFNTSCFVNPPLNTYGNAGIGYLRTDGLTDVDLAILKDFPITEHTRLQFRAESFNTLNSVNFNQPGSTVGTPLFGVVTSAGSPRIIQFALKLIF